MTILSSSRPPCHQLPHFFSLQVPNKAAGQVLPMNECMYTDTLGHLYFYTKLITGCKAREELPETVLFMAIPAWGCSAAPMP